METAETAARYRRFAQAEARGRSPLYEQLAASVAEDPELLAMLHRLPPPNRQPNLLFAAVRFLGATLTGYPAFRRFVLDHADVVLDTMAARRTQTNEVGRCAVLLPVLAQLRGPLALLEVGASAGLCLLPDRYAYDYGTGTVLGDPHAGVVLRCQPSGPVPVPTALPRVVWRRGIDLDPVDVHDDPAVAWLEACVWADQPERLARLRDAVQVARRDPPTLIQGDLVDRVAEVAATAPADATLVVFHAAVLAYLPPERRQRFADQMATLPAVWISLEAPTVVQGLAVKVPDGLLPADTASFLLGRGGDHPVGVADPHGRWVRWLNGG